MKVPYTIAAAARGLVFALAVLSLGASGSSAAEPGKATGKLGGVNFPTSCSPAAQEHFERGLAMLHSFYYPDDLKAFTQATETDPTCAIAYWGIALGQRPNPLVGPWDAATLKRGLDAAQKGLALGPKTERERDWLSAIELFYKDSGKIDQDQRALAYEQAMERLMKKYPTDSEAAIFYALALNETALHSDKTYAKQLKAVAILERIDREQPNHPGVTHYLIHSLDYTPLAQRGVPYADKYAKVAPAAPHAQHMPSHIYSMIGMWEQSVAANQAAVTISREIGAKNFPGTAKVFPQAFHAWDFMEYAHLQMGQDRRAKEVADEIAKAEPSTAVNLGFYTARAAVPARYALERNAWKEAAALEPKNLPYPPAEAITYFARALGSSHLGDIAGAKANIGKLTEFKAALEKSNQGYWAEQVEVQVLAATAWTAHAEGRTADALKLMRGAADLEDHSEKHVSMENRLYPMRELLGDLLLELKQPAEALAEYKASFAAAPNRLRGFYGAARAAELSGNKADATANYRKLAELTRNGDQERPEIAQAKAYLASR